MRRIEQDDSGARHKKLIEALAWQNGESGKVFRATCREAALNFEGKDITCDECDIEECRHRHPGIRDDNRDLFRLVHFSPAVWLQTPMGGGPYALNWPMLLEIAEMLDIVIDNVMTEKLRVYEEKTLEHLKDNSSNSE